MYPSAQLGHLGRSIEHVIEVVRTLRLPHLLGKGISSARSPRKRSALRRQHRQRTSPQHVRREVTQPKTDASLMTRVYSVGASVTNLLQRNLRRAYVSSSPRPFERDLAVLAAGVFHVGADLLRT